MHLDRKGLIEAILSVMEVKIGMCTEAEAQAVLRELQEKPYTIDLASTWKHNVPSSSHSIAVTLGFIPGGATCPVVSKPPLYVYLRALVCWC